SGQFDVALAVNVVYFWRPPLVALREIRRVLRPSGRLVLAAESAETLANVGAIPQNGFGVFSVPALVNLCTEAGFEFDSVRMIPEPASYCMLVRVPTCAT